MESSESASTTSWPTPSVTVARASYRKVTSIIFLCTRRPTQVVGGLEEHRVAFKDAQTYTAIAGWWSIFGLIWTPMTLSRNAKTWHSVQDLLASGSAGPSWLKDPSGKFDERYWDGAKWTDQVRSATSDAPPTV